MRSISCRSILFPFRGGPPGSLPVPSGRPPRPILWDVDAPRAVTHRVLPEAVPPPARPPIRCRDCESAVSTDSTSGRSGVVRAGRWITLRDQHWSTAGAQDPPDCISARWVVPPVMAGRWAQIRSLWTRPAAQWPVAGRVTEAAGNWVFLGSIRYRSGGGQQARAASRHHRRIRTPDTARRG